MKKAIKRDTEQVSQKCMHIIIKLFVLDISRKHVKYISPRLMAIISVRMEYFTKLAICFWVFECSKLKDLRLCEKQTCTTK